MNLLASLFTTSYDDTVPSHTSNILLFVKYSTRSQLDTFRHIINTYDTQQIQDNEVTLMYGGTQTETNQRSQCALRYHQTE